MTPCRSGNNGSSTLISADDAAEARWHDSDERFQSTIVLAAIGIAHVDIQGRYIRVNRWLCDLLGYTRDELLQLTVKQISHPDDRDITDEVRAQLHAGSIEPFQMEKRYLHKNGSPLWVKLTITVRRGASGEPLYDVSVIEDISARKLAKQAVARTGKDVCQPERDQRSNHARPLGGGALPAGMQCGGERRRLCRCGDRSSPAGRAVGTRRGNDRHPMGARSPGFRWTNRNLRGPD